MSKNQEEMILSALLLSLDHPHCAARIKKRFCSIFLVYNFGIFEKNFEKKLKPLFAEKRELKSQVESILAADKSLLRRSGFSGRHKMKYFHLETLVQNKVLSETSTGEIKTMLMEIDEFDYQKELLQVALFETFEKSELLFVY